MDSKGLDVFNSLEGDKARWRCCCPDGRKAACYDGLDSLTVSLQNIWRPLVSAIMSKGQYSLKHSAHFFVLTAASAHQATIPKLNKNSWISRDNSKFNKNR